MADWAAMAELEKRGKLSDDRKALLAEARKRGLAPQAAGGPGKAASLAAGIGQGATFRFGDELLGGLAMAGSQDPYGLSVGTSYTGVRDAARGADAAAREANPLTYLLGEMAGGLSTAGVGALGAVGRTALNLPALAKLLGIGAGFGATAGAGEAENLGDVPAAAGIGAAVGGPLAALIPSAGVGMRNLGRALNPLATRRNAARTLRDDLEQAGLTQDDIARTLRGNPDMVAADVHPQLGQRLQHSGVVNPAVARDAMQTLEQRDAGAARRIQSSLAKVLGDTPTAEAATARSKALSEAAAPLYDEAYATPIEATEAMTRVLQTPRGKAAQRQALASLQNKIDQANLPIIKKKGKPDRLDLARVQAWDEIQRVLGDQAHAQQTIRPARARDYRTLQQTINGGLEEQSPSFAQARNLWRGGQEDLEALKTGTKALTGAVPNLRQSLSEMSESSRWHFRLGVFEKLQDMLGRKGEHDKVTNALKSQRTRDVVKYAFGEMGETGPHPRFDAFMASLGDEVDMERTFNNIKSLSLIDNPLSGYHPGMAPMSGTMAAAQAARHLLMNKLLHPGREREAQHLGTALLSRDVAPLLGRAPAANIGPSALVGGGAAATLPPDMVESLLPSSAPPLPR